MHRRDIAEPLLSNYVSNHSDIADQPASQAQPAQQWWSCGGRVVCQLSRPPVFDPNNKRGPYVTKPNGPHVKTKGLSLNYFASIWPQRGIQFSDGDLLLPRGLILSRLFSLEPYGRLLDLNSRHYFLRANDLTIVIYIFFCFICLSN